MTLIKYTRGLKCTLAAHVTPSTAPRIINRKKTKRTAAKKTPSSDVDVGNPKFPEDLN
ncbi:MULTISPECIES: hypothetical protein [Candidatus Ichthyocystis]|uniref:Putative exported protein n=1 Tax=Candidatus Ichthyocystis hellenicum TaxID=1561003 RepID=A0A0S4M302_9BURK|nr:MULTISPECIES: hypothetical protein [Ichthyocystis]CUT18151.1 putative exported protein [Candidatus Ichthyocystis hellenicum]